MRLLHQVTHTDNKRFICSFCGARFHKLTNMTEHMNAHLGKRNLLHINSILIKTCVFYCLCQFKGLKPYKCEICGKDFGRSNHLRQHQRVNSI